jgi:hypothetical protein
LPIEAITPQGTARHQMPAAHDRRIEQFLSTEIQIPINVRAQPAQRERMKSACLSVMLGQARNVLVGESSLKKQSRKMLKDQTGISIAISVEALSTIGELFMNIFC